jgi:RNA polymerase sigma factor (sigma-70 family)
VRVRTVDTSVIRSQRSGDEVGGTDFEAFYRAESDRIYRALAVTLGNAHLARDATDEAMARAFARWPQVQAHDNPGGWVFRVGLNWATSWWRKVRRERPLPDGDDQHPGIDGSDPQDATALDALRHLAMPQRAVVVCRVLLDLSTVETSALLGVAEGTVKSRLARGLAELRRVLGEEHQ